MVGRMEDAEEAGVNVRLSGQDKNRVTGRCQARVVLHV